MVTKAIHPFPARMAPEIAFQVVKDLKKNSLILDPMMGSGTTLQIGVQNNHHCIGTDVDPLALLIARTSLNYISCDVLEQYLERILKNINRHKLNRPKYWDGETAEFAKFWFAPDQLKEITILSKAIENIKEENVRGVFRIALSRCIITKEKGASLGSDVSHAKPHRTRLINDYNVIKSFEKNSKYIISKIIQFPCEKNCDIFSNDARNLSGIEDKSIDCIITSPPYLHAVDYFRGHRLSLIWMGYTLQGLRTLRSKSIGLQINPKDDNKVDLQFLLRGIGQIQDLPQRQCKHLIKYAYDISSICNEFARVLKKDRKATVVIANAWSAGIQIDNTRLILNAAIVAGLTLVSEHTRQIPATKRYLPPPEIPTNSGLDKRMKTEAILTFAKKH